MLQNFSQPTPKKGTVLWFVLTCVYALSILINEHFELLQALQLNAQTISLIKTIGTLGYMVTTIFNLNQTTNNQTTGNEPPQ
jgi:choline-glycine betaine transporter